MSAFSLFSPSSVTRSWRLLGALLSLSLVSPALIAGCNGQKSSEVARANVKAGDMPEGADWTGVYYSTLYGFLHINKEGKSVSGVWRTANGDAWGELHGEVMGDLLRFSWTEHKIGMVGPSATSSGKGYFKYVRPEGNEEDKIVGEWGLNASDSGNDWDAVKQRNMLPDPDSVKPDELERQGSGGGWDEETAPPPKAGDKGEEVAPE